MPEHLVPEYLQPLMPKSRLEEGETAPGREKSLAGFKKISAGPCRDPWFFCRSSMFAWRMAPAAACWNGPLKFTEWEADRRQDAGTGGHWQGQMQGQGELGPPVSRRLPHLNISTSQRDIPPRQLHQPRPAWALTDHAPCPHPRRPPTAILSVRNSRISHVTHHHSQKKKPIASPAETRRRRCSCSPA